MNNQEINEALAKITGLSYELEQEFEENGGEITETAEGLLQEIESFKVLLQGEGIDSLGRWLKGKEDEKDALKAEKKAAEMRLKACEKSIEYVKLQIGRVLRAVDVKEAKGTYYKFAQSVSTTTSVDNEVLKDEYGDTVEKAIRAAGVPAYVSVTLKASVAAVPEGMELPACFVRTSTDTVKFTKPRKVKED